MAKSGKKAKKQKSISIKKGASKKNLISKKIQPNKSRIEARASTKIAKIVAQKSKVQPEKNKIVPKQKVKPAHSNPFGQSLGGRRGRRPKSMEGYTPVNQEEPYYGEQSNEGLEYDTGISVNKGKGEDGLVQLERFEEFDEELNFDW